MRIFLVTFCAAALGATLALAAPAGAKPPGAPRADRGEDRDKPDKENTGKDDKDKGDKGKNDPAEVDREPSAEQKEYRRGVFERREKAIVAALRQNGPLNDAERDAIRAHWRHVTRLLRIREVAESLKDDVTVKRADALIAHAEQVCDGKLAKLAAQTGGAK